jgi:osmotically-inducible protein OsmY
MSRLRLDKGLADAEIDIEAKGSVVTIRGSLVDAALRQRAVELAQGTVGVEQVVDELGPKE